MKQKYGTQGCYLLKINSRAPNRTSDEQIPDPWSQYLQKNSIQNQVHLKNNQTTKLYFNLCHKDMIVDFYFLRGGWRQGLTMFT